MPDRLYEIEPEDLRAAVAICRLMDGVPLDIEIAANRMLPSACSRWRSW